jgi:apolipoprotein N-acyltransferase
MNAMPKQGKPIKISVIQGNIPQEFKWDDRYIDFTLKQYFSISRSVALDKPDLIVWPEAAAPGILGEDAIVFKKIFSLAGELKIPLLVGAVISENNRYFGSAILIDSAGSLKGRYDKLHRVPFGEYIPLKDVFPFLETVVPIGDIQKGSNFTIFPGGYAVLDCFEDVFPGLAREFVKRGAKFLVNITNDAWYKDTPAPWQHLQASVFRSIENRVYLARSANTGISGFISPTGELISLIKDKTGKATFIAGFATKEIYLSNWGGSFYTRYGDLFILFCFGFIIFQIFFRRL